MRRREGTAGFHVNPIKWERRSSQIRPAVFVGRGTVESGIRKKTSIVYFMVEAKGREGS